MVVGYLLTSFGLAGSILTVNFIIRDKHFNYSAPFAGHELLMLLLLIICVAMTAAGILAIVFSIMKKNNQDRLTRIMNTDEHGRKKNVCPACALNLVAGVEQCPRCDTKILS